LEFAAVKLAGSDELKRCAMKSALRLSAQLHHNKITNRTVSGRVVVLYLSMRKFPVIIRIVIVGLLIGGYGAMYAGSILHDLGHNVTATQHADKHHDSRLAITSASDASHLEVSCFFCSHAPVVSEDLVVEQNWTPSIAMLAPPTEQSSSVLFLSIPLLELRGPPAV
jgi:hypothetical protein